MAFLDGVGKAIGKASQGISDMAKTVNNAAQETRENLSREKRERQAIEAHKCPKCGQPLNSFSVVCPLCNYEIRNAKTAASISELTKEINRLNQKRNTVTEAIASKISGRNENPTDEKIASLISNFVVPNSKEDIIEFMILASGNMDAKFLAGVEKESAVADIVIQAWASKFEQTFQKAKLIITEKEELSKIEDLYETKKQEIENVKNHNRKKRFSLFGKG